MITDETIDLSTAKFWFIMNGTKFDELKEKTRQMAIKNDKKSSEVKKFISKSIGISNRNAIKKNVNEDQKLSFNGLEYDNFHVYSGADGKQHVRVGNGPLTIDALSNPEKWGVEVPQSSSAYRQALGQSNEFNGNGISPVFQDYMKVLKSKSIDQSTKDAIELQYQQQIKNSQYMRDLMKNIGDEQSFDYDGQVKSANDWIASLSKMNPTQVKDEVSRSQQMLDQQNQSISDIKREVSLNGTFKQKLLKNFLEYGLGTEIDDAGNDIGTGFGVGDGIMGLPGAGAVVKTALVKPIAKSAVKSAMKKTVSTAVKSQVGGAVAGAAISKGIDIATSSDETENEQKLDSIRKANNAAAAVSQGISMKTAMVSIGALAALTFGIYGTVKLWKKFFGKGSKQDSHDLDITYCEFQAEKDKYMCSYSAKDKKWSLQKNGSLADKQELESLMSTSFMKKFQDECQKKLEKLHRNLHFCFPIAKVSGSKNQLEALTLVRDDFSSIMKNMKYS